MIQILRLSFAFLALLLFSLGCGGGEEPTQRVQLGPQLLDMAISDQWEIEDGTDASRIYRHSQLHDLRLSFSAETQDMGQPLQVRHVKSLIGKEINRRYGGASAHLTFGGNAMIKYARTEQDSDGESVRLQEWILGKPFGHSAVARISISLRIPASLEANPELAELVDRLDKQVGDATIPQS